MVFNVFKPASFSNIQLVSLWSYFLMLKSPHLDLALLGTFFAPLTKCIILIESLAIKQSMGMVVRG